MLYGSDGWYGSCVSREENVTCMNSWLEGAAPRRQGANGVWCAIPTQDIGKDAPGGCRAVRDQAIEDYEDGVCISLGFGRCLWTSKLKPPYLFDCRAWDSNRNPVAQRPLRHDYPCMIHAKGAKLPPANETTRVS